MVRWIRGSAGRVEPPAVAPPGAASAAGRDRQAGVAGAHLTDGARGVPGQGPHRKHAQALAAGTVLDLLGIGESEHLRNDVIDADHRGHSQLIPTKAEAMGRKQAAELLITAIGGIEGLAHHRQPFPGQPLGQHRQGVPEFQVGTALLQQAEGRALQEVGFAVGDGGAFDIKIETIQSQGVDGVAIGGGQVGGTATRSSPISRRIATAWSLVLVRERVGKPPQAASPVGVACRKARVNRPTPCFRASPSRSGTG